jgi:hypothetical protein
MLRNGPRARPPLNSQRLWRCDCLLMRLGRRLPLAVKLPTQVSPLDRRLHQRSFGF